MHAAFSTVPVTTPSGPTAFSDLVTRHQASVVGATLGVLLDRARAEEVAQEAFLIAWQKLEAGERVDNRTAWLCGIARNLARNAARRKREVALEIDRAEDAPSALDRLLERERDVEVNRALDALPEKYRAPLVMFYVGGESVRDVAEALDLKEAAVRQRLGRARERVRAQLAAVEQDLRSRRPTATFTALAVAAWASRAKPVAAEAGTTVALKVVGAALLGVFAVSGALLVRPASRVSTRSPVGTSTSTASMTTTAPAVRRTVPSTRAVATTPAVATEAALPDGLRRELDLDMSGLTASAALNLLGEATGVPICVAPGEDLSARVNHRAADEAAITLVDEVLAQAGAERRTASLLTLGSNLATVALPDVPLIEVDASGRPLADVVEAIGLQLGQPIYLPASAACADAECRTKTLVHVDIHGLTPTAALRAVLPSGLGYEYRIGLLVSLEQP